MRQAMVKLIGLLLVPGVALAHPVAGTGNSFMHGISHPVGGADHWLAMVAVGLWAVHLGGRALWLIPSAFVAVMMLGGALGVAGVVDSGMVDLGAVEQGILASVFVLGFLIAGAFRLPVAISAVIASSMAVVHGIAHGVEMPLAATSWSYIAGFALAAALLSGLGVCLGVWLQTTPAQMSGRRPYSQYLGGAIALSGLYLAMA